ncbi:MAG: hypothetical protein ACRDG7_10880 [Candidatus Limnocylindria bacterium]
MLDLHNVGSVVLLLGIEVHLALAAVNLGIFLTTFARYEFQAVQIISLVAVPQVSCPACSCPSMRSPSGCRSCRTRSR